MAKRTYAYDGSEWVGLASPSVDVSNYANMATTQISGFRNAIINGDFRIWQRGTSFSSPASGTFVSDRWVAFFDGTGTKTFSQQLFALGTAPVAGYEGQFFLRCNQSVAGTGGTFNEYNQKIENVRTFAGQTVSVSFWAKAASTTVLPSLILRQEFGTGGSPSTSVNTTVASSISVGTSWTRFTYTTTLPSLSGKTIGTSGTDNLTFILALPLNSTFTVDIWGVQVEPGSTATPFEQRPIGVELALCQRYYQMLKSGATNSPVLTRIYSTQNNYDGMISYLVKPRISSGFNYSVNSPANVIHKPGIRWDTISSITFTDMGSYLHISCTPSADDGGAMLGMYLYGIDIFCNAEL